ncbi:MAG: hypothetical protein WCD02_06370 [Terriglobales bacterium]
MRTFPKALAVFREIVSERGQKLRQLKFEELRQLIKPLPDCPIERLTVDSRPATIGIVVEPKADGALRVVVQGFMNARHVPLVKHVALDGFYKHSDETVTPMPAVEFYEFD